MIVERVGSGMEVETVKAGAPDLTTNAVKSISRAVAWVFATLDTSRSTAVHIIAVDASKYFPTRHFGFRVFVLCPGVELCCA